MEDGEGVSLSRVASRYPAASVTMAGTLVRTEMDPVPKPRVTPLLETQQVRSLSWSPQCGSFS